MRSGKKLEIPDLHIEEVAIPEPSRETWDSVADFRKQLEALYREDEYVNICDGRKSGEKWVPSTGIVCKVADMLKLCDEMTSLGKGIEEYEKEAGMWIRINPVKNDCASDDGNKASKTVSDKDVADYRHVLVECDTLDMEKQMAFAKALELPVTLAVWSGGKSVHLVVKIDAGTADEYSKRVEMVYEVCRANGFPVDKANRNPSRLMRLAGAERGDGIQYVIGESFGKACYAEWEKWVSNQIDGLGEPFSCKKVLDDVIDDREELIEGVLHAGAKMILSAPSKSGKSFCMIKLAHAIACGGEWLGHKCMKGKVLWIDCELDEKEALKRLKAVNEDLRVSKSDCKDIYLWPLRGKAAPLSEILDSLLLRIKKDEYSLIIIDPIYKLMAGDENSVGDNREFAIALDKLIEASGAAVVYSHHHRKGALGDQRSTDRASGTGLLARDSDAILDMIELEVSADLRDKIKGKLVTEDLYGKARLRTPAWKPAKKVMDYSTDELSNELRSNEVMSEAEICKVTQAAEEKFSSVSAFRIEFTLRSFRKPELANFLFAYPLHIADKWGITANCRAYKERTKSSSGKKAPKKDAQLLKDEAAPVKRGNNKVAESEKNRELVMASYLRMKKEQGDREPSNSAIAKATGLSTKTVANHLRMARLSMITKESA